MFSEHLTRMNAIKDELQSKITSAEDIAGILYKSAVLTLDELDAVNRCNRTSANPGQKLIEILLLKPTPEEYYCFLDALKQKNLTDAYTLLTLPGKIVRLRATTRSKILCDVK